MSEVLSLEAISSLEPKVLDDYLVQWWPVLCHDKLKEAPIEQQKIYLTSLSIDIKMKIESKELWKCLLKLYSNRNPKDKENKEEKQEKQKMSLVDLLYNNINDISLVLHAISNPNIRWIELGDTSDIEKKEEANDFDNESIEVLEAILHWGKVENNQFERHVIVGWIFQLPRINLYCHRLASEQAAMLFRDLFYSPIRARQVANAKYFQERNYIKASGHTHFLSLYGYSLILGFQKNLEDFHNLRSVFVFTKSKLPSEEEIKYILPNLKTQFHEYWSECVDEEIKKTIIEDYEILMEYNAFDEWFVEAANSDTISINKNIYNQFDVFQYICKTIGIKLLVGNTDQDFDYDKPSFSLLDSEEIVSFQTRISIPLINKGITVVK